MESAGHDFAADVNYGRVICEVDPENWALA